MKPNKPSGKRGSFESLVRLAQSKGLESIVYPGLSSGARDIDRLWRKIPKGLAMLTYQKQSSQFWVAFVGGTGTGKSTLFNALCGKRLSETGVERPKTSGPIAYACSAVPVENDFPLRGIRLQRHPLNHEPMTPYAGEPGSLLVIENKKEDGSHLVFIDTPDLDSVEAENRRVAEDIGALSNAFVFVTSQEKYADEVPSQFLKKIIEDNKPFYFLLNKVQTPLSKSEITEALGSRGFTFSKDRVWPIAYVPSEVSKKISEQSSFKDFVRRLHQELSESAVQGIKREQNVWRAKGLKNQVERLIVFLEEENRACKNWIQKLDRFFEDISGDLIRDEKERFSEKNREYLRNEIRKLFARYDVLARPRRAFQSLILMPFRILGFMREGGERSHKKALREVGQKTDMAPVQRTLEKFNRLVLEKLSPGDEASVLFERLRRPEVILADEEVKERLREEQEKLTAWLEETFRTLSRGIPKSKRWGIYSTSILWGIMILALETAVGGGFTVLDAALDSALAPFVTKGTVELFAYHEIRNIAGELSDRYQKALLSPLEEQRHRYEKSLQSSMTDPDTVAYLLDLKKTLEGFEP